MEGEIERLIFVWATALASLVASHTITIRLRIAPAGTKRLLAFLPVVAVFFCLPLLLTSVHFSGTTSFFIAWLANFKLLLFAFARGPLHSDPPLPLSTFVLTAALPIKITKPNHHTNHTNQTNIVNAKPSSPNILMIIKLMLLIFLFKLYAYREYFHPLIKMALFCVHIYLVLDLGLASVAYVARAMLGVDLEPQFHEPYMATSLQDFWGKRWNLMVTGILHPAVYVPVRSVSGRFLTKKVAPFPAVVASFVVSGLMHELIFYYIGRVKPTWEVTWFFVIHGVLSGAEVVVKRVVGHGVRVPGVVSGAATLGVVMGTSFWLFFPPFLRGDTEVRSCKEFVAFMELVVHRRFVAPDHVSCPYF